MQKDFRQFGDYKDAKTFLAKRAEVIRTCNNEMSELHKKVKDQLFIMPENTNDEIILHRIPLKALVFHDEDDRNGKINHTFVNWGEYHINTVEVYYGEYIRSGEITAIRWIGLNLLGKQPHKSIEDFCKTNKFGGFDDEKLSWGRNCFFLNKEEYLLFKDTITKLGKELGVIKEEKEKK